MRSFPLIEQVLSAFDVSSAIERDDMRSAGMLAFARATMKYDASRGPRELYLRRMVWNGMQDARRAWRRTTRTKDGVRGYRPSSVSLDDLVFVEDPEAEREMLRAELRINIRAAIDMLPEDEATIVLGHYYEDETIQDVGARIGKSKSWTSRLHDRALARLKRMPEVAA